MDSEFLRDNADDVHQDTDEWGICVASKDGMDVEEIAKTNELRNGRMRTSTVGRLRERGYEVTPTPDFGPTSAVVKLPIDPRSEPTEEDWDKLRECFDEPVPNPAQEDRR